MTEEQYIEREYADYEDTSLRDDVFWRVPAYALAGTPLFAVFELLCKKFPDHPNDHNTVFYLFDHFGVSPTHYSVLLRCSHFEHSSLEDVCELGDFLSQAARCIADGESADVELLDGCGERLHVRFYFPREDMVRVLQERATRVRPNKSLHHAH